MTTKGQYYRKLSSQFHTYDNVGSFHAKRHCEERDVSLPSEQAPQSHSRTKEIASRSLSLTSLRARNDRKS